MSQQFSRAHFFAVNGKVNSGDVYRSNALFRKMWAKMLTAAANEAAFWAKANATAMMIGINYQMMFPMAVY